MGNDDSNAFEFMAEVIEVKSKKLVSLDVEYRVILRGDNPAILELGRLPADTMLKVIIEIDK